MHKNFSQLEDERSTEVIELAKKRFAPIGHVYSVITEQFNAKPLIEDFIDFINDELGKEGEYLLMIEDPLDYFTPTTMSCLVEYLKTNYTNQDPSNHKKCIKVLKEATGGYESEWTRIYRLYN